MTKMAVEDQILEAYLSQSPEQLKKISEENGVHLKECEKYWNEWKSLGENFRSHVTYEPSQMTVNKIIAHAREQASTQSFLQKTASFWQFLFKPNAFAGVMAALIVGLFSIYQFESQNKQTSQQNETFSFSQTVQEHVYRTPLDHKKDPILTFEPKSHLIRQYGVASPVSVGSQAGLAVDEDIDQKILSREILSDQEVNVLFYRARKLERLGYYREALQDYQILANLYPKYKHQRTIQLAMANCYENLQEKDKAILVLEKFELTYGQSNELDIWIDDLKSETF